MGETTYDIIDTIQGGTIYGLQHVLLSMSGNCRRLRLYTRRCLRQTAFRIDLQDLLVYVTKGLSAVTTRLREEGMPVSGNVNHLVTFNLFVTITNANFDEDFITDRIIKTLEQTQLLLRQLKDTSDLPDASTWYGAVDTFTEKAAEYRHLIQR